MIELLTASTLMGVVALSFAAVYVTAHRFLFQSINIANSQGEASYSLEHMRRQLMNANLFILFSPQAAPPPGSPPFSDPTAPWSNQGFMFRFDPANPGPGTPIDFTDDQWAGYRVNGTTLQYLPFAKPFDGVTGNINPTLTEFTGAADDGTAAVRNITNLVFARPNAARLDIDMTTSATSGGDTRNSRQVTSISPRGVQ